MSLEAKLRQLQLTADMHYVELQCLERIYLRLVPHKHNLTQVNRICQVFENREHALFYNCALVLGDVKLLVRK